MASYVVEGCHIRPIGKPHYGKDIASNILILCPNDHVLTEVGLILIHPETLDIWEKINNGYCNTGRKLKIGQGEINEERKRFTEKRYLRYHWEQFYDFTEKQVIGEIIELFG